MQVLVLATMGQIEVFSPAKINLFLAVLGRRDDGFHALASLVGQLDFGDTLRLDVTEASAASVELSCSDASLPTDRSNLAFAAAESFLLQSGLSWRVRIELEKRIPHGAGLGGGSSNASAVLRGLSELAEAQGELGLSRGERLELAAALGSDCPLFLDASPKWMRGRGELLQTLSPDKRASLLGQKVLLFKPSFSIRTAEAYGSLAEHPENYESEDWTEGRIAAWSKGDLTLGELLSNSFEKSIFPKYIAFESLFKQLTDKGLHCLMSGSGSCCFALLDSEEQARMAEALIRQAWGDRCFVQLASVVG